MPSGAKLIRNEPDGMMVVETTNDPMEWLQSLPHGAVGSAEVGVDRLEDLYQVLLRDEVTPHCGVDPHLTDLDAAGGDQ